MGLDMYLYTASEGLADKVCQWHVDNNYWIKNTPVCGFYKKRGVIGYWWKADAIYKWFVKHVQCGEDNCRRYDISLENLSELLQTCEKVLNDKSLASELLPTQTEYNFWYDREVRYTYELCKFLLENLEEKEDILYFKHGSENWDVRLEYRASW